MKKILHLLMQILFKYQDNNGGGEDDKQEEELRKWPALLMASLHPHPKSHLSYQYNFFLFWQWHT